MDMSQEPAEKQILELKVFEGVDCYRMVLEGKQSFLRWESKGSSMEQALEALKGEVNQTYTWVVSINSEDK